MAQVTNDEFTFTLDELGLEDWDDEEAVEDAVSSSLEFIYGKTPKSFEWECGDDVDCINVFRIII